MQINTTLNPSLLQLFFEDACEPEVSGTCTSPFLDTDEVKMAFWAR